MREYRLFRMTWEEAGKAVQDAKAVIIPVGSTEQHGRHVPLDNDYFTSVTLADFWAKDCQEAGLFVVVTPPLCFGISWYHMDFPGTITFKPSTFMTAIREICESLWHHGFRNLVLLNSHGGNSAALTVAVTELYAEHRKRALVVNWGSLVSDAVKELGIKSPMIHVEEIETSVCLALGQRVEMDRAARDAFSRREIHRTQGLPTSRHIAYDSLEPGDGVVTPMDFIKDISASGVVGDATLATREKGEVLLKTIRKKLVGLVHDLAQ